MPISKKDNRLVAALLAVPESTASTIYGMYDLFSAVGRDWALLKGETPGPAPVRPLVVAETDQRFRAGNGVWLQPDQRFDQCTQPDIVCVPDLFVAPDEDLTDRYSAEIAWLHRAYAGGATIAAACSGTLLLAEAGLLDDGEATTHWGYCEGMARRYPRITVHPARALVATGEGQRILSSGGGTSWQDLALFLVARFFGTEEAMQIARVYLMDWHRQGQLPFAGLAQGRQAEDRLIAQSQAWLADHYAEPGPVAAMAARSGLAERSFKRRFTRATGMSPMDYVHTLRLEEAKQILEKTDLPVEAVANEVGYEDASFFRRLFRRRAGLTPRDYRTRFAAVRRALQSASPQTAQAAE